MADRYLAGILSGPGFVKTAEADDLERTLIIWSVPY